METNDSEKKKLRQSSVGIFTGGAVRISTLVFVLAALVTGAVAAMVIHNALGSESIVFSTTGLVTLLFGIALSSASIILALAAISLGRASEYAMIQRSDESIRIQNEVFAKTTEALARIESSTGVTEKRIEDIISGRAGMISDTIAERLLKDRGFQTKDRDDLQREIRESILDEIKRPRPLPSPEEKEAFMRRRLKEAKMRKRYAAFKDDVLLGIVNKPSVKAQKMGDGSFRARGNGLVDGIFVLRSSSERFSVSTFKAGEDHLHEENPPQLSQYIRDLASEITQGTFTKSFLVFDSDVNDQEELQGVLTELRTIGSEDLLSSVVVVSGTAEHVVQRIFDEISPDELVA